MTRNWVIHQLDVKNAFLHEDLQKKIYLNEPLGFVDPSQPKHVCLLCFSLYSLKHLGIIALLHTSFFGFY